MLSKVRMKRSEYNEKRTCRVVVDFSDGAQLTSLLRDNATEWKPASDEEVYGKYAVLMRDTPVVACAQTLERLQTLEFQPVMDWLSFHAE